MCLVIEHDAYNSLNCKWLVVSDQSIYPPAFLVPIVILCVTLLVIALFNCIHCIVIDNCSVLTTAVSVVQTGTSVTELNMQANENSATSEAVDNISHCK